jgi:hypothetical protein
MHEQWRTFRTGGGRETKEQFQKRVGAEWKQLGPQQQQPYVAKSEQNKAGRAPYKEKTRLAFRLLMMIVAPAKGSRMIAPVATGLDLNRGTFAECAEDRARAESGGPMWPRTRATRSDATSAADIALMKQFWTEQCPASPSVRDCIRLRICKKHWEVSNRR